MIHESITMPDAYTRSRFITIFIFKSSNDRSLCFIVSSVINIEKKDATALIELSLQNRYDFTFAFVIVDYMDVGRKKF